MDKRLFTQENVREYIDVFMWVKLYRTIYCVFFLVFGSLFSIIHIAGILYLLRLSQLVEGCDFKKLKQITFTVIVGILKGSIDGILFSYHVSPIVFAKMGIADKVTNLKENRVVIDKVYFLMNVLHGLIVLYVLYKCIISWLLWIIVLTILPSC